jgi:5-methylthioadenosine/S-adenosylhomocysteine deaminase
MRAVMTDFAAQPVLIQARYVVPVLPERKILENHAVVIKGEHIIDLLPSELARTRYAGAGEVNLGHHVLIPGLINMHTHSPMTLLRGYADDLPLKQWLTEFIWPAEQRHVGPRFVADGTRLAIAEMLRAGTTCFNDNYFFPDVMAETVSETGIRACIGLPVIELATAWAANVEECLEKGLDLLNRESRSPLVRFSLAPHAPYSVTDATLRRLSDLSAEYEVPVHLHMLEARWETRHSLDQHGITPVQRLLNLQLLNSRLLAVHITQISDAEIDVLAEHGVNVIHCPQSNLKLASGICPVAKLQAANVNVAIGTDGAASNNNLDLLSEAQTAALLAKGASDNPQAVDAFAALEMITINGARALKLDGHIGSIEPGKLADLAALDLQCPETQPVYNLFSQLIYAASSRQFSDVWVSGKRLLHDGRLTTIDIGSVLEAAEDWRSRLSADIRHHHTSHKA